MRTRRLSYRFCTRASDIVARVCRASAKLPQWVKYARANCERGTDKSGYAVHVTAFCVCAYLCTHAGDCRPAPAYAQLLGTRVLINPARLAQALEQPTVFRCAYSISTMTTIEWMRREKGTSHGEHLQQHTKHHTRFTWICARDCLSVQRGVS